MSIRFLDHGAVLRDLERLPSLRLRAVALGWLRRLERDPSLGQPCGWSASTGDLGDCWKLYFDHTDDPRVVALEPRRVERHYRIVFRRLDGDVEVVAIGPGHPPPDYDAVYVRAGRRLRRM